MSSCRIVRYSDITPDKVFGLRDYLQGFVCIVDGTLFLLDEKSSVIGHLAYRFDYEGGNSLNVEFVHISESRRGEGLSWLLASALADEVFPLLEWRDGSITVNLPDYHVISAEGDLFYAQLKECLVRQMSTAEVEVLRRRFQSK